MSRRSELHNKLCDILSCPHFGTSCRAYYQPPSSVKMQYPAIVYSLNGIATEYADNRVYMAARSYKVTIVDKNPDSELVDKMINSFMALKFDRSYASDNLNHFVFEILY